MESNAQKMPRVHTQMFIKATRVHKVWFDYIRKICGGKNMKCWCCGGRGFTAYKGLKWHCNICAGTGETEIIPIPEDYTMNRVRLK